MKAILFFVMLFGISVTPFLRASDTSMECFDLLFPENFAISNCGVNATIFSCCFFGKPVASTSIVNSLGTTARMQRACSFEDISRTLKMSGLYCMAYKGCSIDDVQRNIEHSTLALVHIRTGAEFHYIVLTRARDMAAIFNFPNPVKKADWADVKSAYASLMTGAVMFVSDRPMRLLETAVNNQAPQSKNPPLHPLQPAIDSPSREFHRGDGIVVPKDLRIGKSSRDSDHFEVNLNVENVSNTRISLESVRGECSCFLGAAQLPCDVMPHQAVSITLRFRKSNFDLKRGTRIALASNDRSLPVAFIRVGSMGGVENGRQFVYVPTKVVDLGRTSLLNVRKARISFPILLDEGVEARVELVPDCFDKTVYSVSMREANLRLKDRNLKGVVADVAIVRPNMGAFRESFSFQVNSLGREPEIVSVVLHGTIQ